MGVGTAIFAIADDRVADRCHMNPELMGSPRDRPQRHPRKFPARGLDDAIAGQRVLRLFASILGNHHPLFAQLSPLYEWRLDRPLLRAGNADDQRPIYLLGLMVFEGSYSDA